MRIAVFVSRFPSVSQTFVLNQLVGLIDAGHEVDIYSGIPDAGALKRQHEDVARYGLLDRVSYWPERRSGSSRAKRRGQGAAGPRALSRALRVLAWSLRRGVWPAELAKAIVTCDAPEYDVVYCHFATVGRYAERLRAMGAVTGPLVVVFHGYDISRVLDKRGQGYYRRLLANAELLLPISDFWRERLMSLGADPGRCEVHRMAIDTRLFAFRPRRPSADGVMRIVTIARCVEKKGLFDALSAIRELANHHPGRVEYHLVGSGPLRARLEQAVADGDLGEVVTFHGVLSQQSVAALLDEMHVMLAPSVTASDGDMEGIPVALMEAMAVGLPVVTTRHSGIPELVEDGVSGHLVDERDVDGLVERLEGLMAAPDSWVELGRAGRRRVEEDFDVATWNARLIEQFASVATAHLQG
jgi:colanic acid/amylovoran biosynthesis glycosyltransferase